MEQTEEQLTLPFEELEEKPQITFEEVKTKKTATVVVNIFHEILINKEAKTHLDSKLVEKFVIFEGSQQVEEYLNKNHLENCKTIEVRFKPFAPVSMYSEKKEDNYTWVKEEYVSKWIKSRQIHETNTSQRQKEQGTN